MTAVTLQIPQSLKFTDDEFVEIVAANKDLRLELSHQGELIVMSPTGGETGNRNFEMCLDLGYWNRQNNLGKAFDSSTGFKLPNGATRSPDVSWIKIERWNALTQEQRKKFLPLCPDFVIELVNFQSKLVVKHLLPFRTFPDVLLRFLEFFDDVVFPIDFFQRQFFHLQKQID